MNLVETLRGMVQRRADLAEELASIDRELAEVRALLSGDTPDVSAAVVSMVRAFDDARDCERCGKSFKPSLGSTGRWCSQQCYAGGLSIEDRRARIVDAVRTLGPIYVSGLREIDGLSAVSGSTINNDLYRLARDGVVVNTGDGWRIAEEQAVAVDSEAPFAQRSVAN